MTGRRMIIYGRTEQGPVRAANEDHVLVGRFVKNRGGTMLVVADDDDVVARYGLVCAVADGIGGAAGGATASRVALRAFDAQFYSVEKIDEPLEKVEEAVRAAATRANETLLTLATQRPELNGMGCTISGVALSIGGYVVFNAGDSRVYRLRDDVAKQLTEDDSLVQLAVRAGEMGAAEAERSDHRHTITNFLGTAGLNLSVEVGPPLRDGDTLLICSDGLHDLLADAELAELCADFDRRRLAGGDVAEHTVHLVDRLLARAVENGGHDNISLIAVHLAAAVGAAAAPAVTGANGAGVATDTDVPPALPTAAVAASPEPRGGDSV